MQRYTRQQSVIAYWGMGLYWGRALSQNKKGHLLGHVKVGVLSCHRLTCICASHDHPSGWCSR